MAAGVVQQVYFGITEEGNFGRLPGPPEQAHQDYPCFRFKLGEDGKMQQVYCQNEEEERALGEGWSDRPDGPRRRPEADEMEEFRKWKEAQAQASKAVEQVTGEDRITGTITLKNKGGRKFGSKNKPKPMPSDNGPPKAA